MNKSIIVFGAPLNSHKIYSLNPLLRPVVSLERPLNIFHVNIRLNQDTKRLFTLPASLKSTLLDGKGGRSGEALLCVCDKHAIITMYHMMILLQRKQYIYIRCM